MCVHVCARVCVCVCACVCMYVLQMCVVHVYVESGVLQSRLVRQVDWWSTSYLELLIWWGWSLHSAEMNFTVCGSFTNGNAVSKQILLKLCMYPYLCVHICAIYAYGMSVSLVVQF